MLVLVLLSPTAYLAVVVTEGKLQQGVCTCVRYGFRELSAKLSDNCADYTDVPKILAKQGK